MDDEGQLRCSGRYAIDFDLKDFPGLRPSDTAASEDAPAAAAAESDAESAAKTEAKTAEAAEAGSGEEEAAAATTGGGARGHVSQKAGRREYEAGMVVVDASLHRNEMAFMNDYRWAPLAEADADGTAWVRQPNVDTYTSVHHLGAPGAQAMWPCVVVRATRDIMAGEELLWDYGELYWKLLAETEVGSPRQGAVEEECFAERRGTAIGAMERFGRGA